MKRKFLNILSIAVICLSLQACVAAAIASLVGGGGYYVGKRATAREEERIKTEALVDIKQEVAQREQADAQQDNSITSQINQNYLAGALTGEIAVYPEVKDGVVILHGRVPDAATAERAINAARNTQGVQRIISNLVIINQQPSGLQQQFQPQQFQPQGLYTPPPVQQQGIPPMVQPVGQPVGQPMGQQPIQYAPQQPVPQPFKRTLSPQSMSGIPVNLEQQSNAQNIIFTPEGFKSAEEFKKKIL